LDAILGNLRVVWSMSADTKRYETDLLRDHEE